MNTAEKTRTAYGDKLQKISGHFWAGPDMYTQHEQVIHCKQTGEVTLQLPNISKAIDRLFPDGDALIGIHTSSRAIQHGLVFPKDAAKDVTEAIRQESGPVVAVTVPLENHAHQSLELPQKSRAAIIYLWNRQTIEGEQLEELLTQQQHGVVLSGEQGRDWQVRRDESGKAVGVNLALNTRPEKIMWFPQSISSTTPLRIPVEKAAKFRTIIDERLTRFSQHKPNPGDSEFVIMESKSSISLGPKVHIVIPNEVPGAKSAENFGNEGQGNSPILLGGRTNWEARFEIDTATVPDTMFVQFAKAAKLRI